MSHRALSLLLLLGCGCGQQLVEFAADDRDGGLDQAGPDLGGDLAGVDLAGLDLTGVDGGPIDLSFPFDLSGDMAAPCRALELDGVHAIATANPQSFHNTFGAVTVEAWVYQTARGPNEAVVAGHWGNPANNTASHVLLIDATGHLVFRASALGGNGNAVTSTAVVPLNTWTHVAGQLAPTVPGSNISVFINNGTPTTFAQTLIYSTAQPAGIPLHIGRYSSASPDERPFTGFMHDVRYSSVARYPSNTAPQVRLLPDGATIALYHFDEATGSNAADTSSHAIPAALLQNAKFGVPPVCP